MIGFRSAYGGVGYLLAGLIGIALGIAVTELARRWGQPVLAEAFITVALFILLGGAVAAPTSAIGRILPTASTLHALGHVGIYGWKELLTTAPPVGNASDLLALPYIIGLVGGVAGQSVARRTPFAAAPLVGPLLVLALSILLGAQHPASLALQGALFGSVALAWVAVRYHRTRPVVSVQGGRSHRAAIGLALLALAGLAGWVLGPVLPGAGRGRVVLSNYVVPPFDANQQQSPLAAFREYVTGGALNQQLLFTVRGVPSQSLVRIATMDAYDGLVWGFAAASSSRAGAATDAFQRYGSMIPSPVTGVSHQVTVQIRAVGGVWLPQVGEPTKLAFSGTGSAALSSGLRFDVATGTGAEPGGISEGDTYSLTTVEPRQPSARQLAGAVPGDLTLAISGVPAVLQTDASQWSSGGSSAWAKVMAIAEHLRTDGYYSDGADPSAPGSPVLSLPGHGEGRLTSFLRGGGLVGTDIVGDDEQYAATFALMANAVGVPSRVVLGAQVEADGSVHGSDVHAWVEVSLAGLGWVPIKWGSFTPTRPAQETPPMQAPQNAPSSAVAPPVVTSLRQPLDDQLPGSTTNGISRKSLPHRTPFKLPAWVLKAGWALLALAIVLGLPLGAIVGLKARRRARRRGAPTTSSQIAGAWSELVDLARDLGQVLPVGRTRRELATVLNTPEAADLAVTADAAVFGVGEASSAEVAQYWTDVERYAKGLRQGLSRAQRLRASYSLRSLRTAGVAPRRP